MPATVTADYQVKIDELVLANRELIKSSKDSDDGIMSEEDVKTYDANMIQITALTAQGKREEEMAALDEPAPSKIVGKVQVISEPGDRPHGGFAKPRDFLACVIKAGQGFKVDTRLNAFIPDAAVGSDEQGTHSNPLGGFLVPDAFSPELLMVPTEADPTVGQTTDVPMEAQAIKINARVDKDHTTSVSGGLTVSRKAEATSGSSSTMTFEQIELRAKTLFGLSYVTEELLADSPISFAAILEQGFQDEFAATILDEKINGTGVGQMQGVIGAPGTIEQAKEGSQTADTVVFENVINMRSRCWRYGDAIWLAAHDTMPQLAAMNDGTNHIYLQSLREDVPELLLGRPIFFSEFVPKLGDAGDIVLGNWSQYLVGLYQAAQNAESMHVRFDSHERAFKFWLRNDGQPWWRSALTPKNGGATLSPFVTLAERA